MEILKKNMRIERFYYDYEDPTGHKIYEDDAVLSELTTVGEFLKLTNRLNELYWENKLLKTSRFKVYEDLWHAIDGGYDAIYDTVTDEYYYIRCGDESDTMKLCKLLNNLTHTDNRCYVKSAPLPDESLRRIESLTRGVVKKDD